MADDGKGAGDFGTLNFVEENAGVKELAEWEKKHKSLRPLYKKARQDFVAFTNHYNVENGLDLDKDAKDALTKLHKMWKKATVKTIDKDDFEYFHKMKDLHVPINTKLLGADEFWTEYINSVQLYRLGITVDIFELMKLGEQILDAGFADAARKAGGGHHGGPGGPSSSSSSTH